MVVETQSWIELWNSVPSCVFSVLFLKNHWKIFHSIQGMWPPGSQWGAEINKVALGLFFLLWEGGGTKTQGGGGLISTGWLATFRHIQNPIIEINQGTLQSRNFSYLPLCFIAICKCNMMNFLLKWEIMCSKNKHSTFKSKTFSTTLCFVMKAEN